MPKHGIRDIVCRFQCYVYLLSTSCVDRPCPVYPDSAALHRVPYPHHRHTAGDSTIDLPRVVRWAAYLPRCVHGLMVVHRASSVSRYVYPVDDQRGVTIEAPWEGV